MMKGVIAPTTVWAVRIGVSNEDAEGTLSLEQDHLVFTIEEGSLQIPLASVRRVRRVRGSPVMLVDQNEGGRVAKFAFFFAKPPPLEPEGRTTRRRNRRSSMSYLGMANRARKESVAKWVRAIKQAAEAAKGR